MKAATLLALVLMASFAAFGQDEAISQAISLSAANQEWHGNVWRGSGGVRILYQDIAISCDEIEYDGTTMEVVARGHVIFDQGPRRFSAEELHFNLRNKTGIFLVATADMPPSYHFSGARMEQLDESHYLIEDATFTSCGDKERPPWDFRIRRGLIEDEGYGRFRAASLRVKGFPVFQLPYLLWPIKKDRALGLMIPTIGYSQLRGALLGTALFIPIGRSFDTTVMLDIYSGGYLGVGSELRWAPTQGANGNLNLYTIRDKNTGDWEWKINGKHRQDNFFGFRLLAEVHDLSDNIFFQEFDRTFDQNTRRSLYSYLYLSRSWGPYALNLRADQRTTFLDSGDSGNVVLAQLPEVELRVRSTRVGMTELYWTLISSINYFSVDRGGDLKGSYARVDLFPTVSYTLPGPPWLTVTPTIGGRATVYSSRYSEDTSAPITFVDKWIDRTYMSAGVDIVGPSISKIYDRPAGSFSKFKHLIEPRVEYTYLSDVDSTLIPVFDEVDSARPSNRARLTLSNRLFGKSAQGIGARELGTFDLTQDFSFSEPLSHGAEGATSQRGPLGASLRLTPVTGIIFDIRTSYDTLHKNMQSTSLAGNISHSGITSGITWYQSFSPSTGERSRSQVRLLFNLRKPDLPWSTKLHLAYDVENGDFQQQQYQVHYEGSCWGISAEYRNLSGIYPTRDYRITISLKDVGKLPEIHGNIGDSSGGY